MSFLGMDPAGVRGLAAALSACASEVESIVPLVAEAEALCDLPTNTQGPLRQIATDCTAMAAAVTSAADEFEAFEIEIDLMIVESPEAQAVVRAQDELDRLSDMAEDGRISKNDPRIDEAMRTLAAAEAAVAAAASAAVPSIEHPASLSDAALADAINGWAGTDNDPLLDGLLREQDNRIEPEGGWVTLGQFNVTRSLFADRAHNGPTALNPNDPIGAELADILEGEGYLPAQAEEIAAGLRARYPGIEVRDYEGYKHLIDNAHLILGAAADGGQPTLDDFLDSGGEHGISTVVGLNGDLYDAGLDSIETYAGFEGVEVTDQMVTDIFAFAQRRGLDTSTAAQMYFGISVVDPPAGESAVAVAAPLIREQSVIIDLEQRAADAMAGLPTLTDQLDDSEWSHGVLHYYTAPGQRSSWDYRPDLNGDGIPDVDAELDHIDADQVRRLNEEIRAAISDVEATAPPAQVLANQKEYIAALKQVQNGVSLISLGYEAEHYTDDQLRVFATLSDHQDELIDLVAPGWGSEYDGTATLPILHNDFLLANVDPYDGTNLIAESDGHLVMANGASPISLAEIERVLEIYESQQGGPPGTALIISPALASAFRSLLRDPELIEALAPRDSNDLFAHPESLASVDLFFNPSRAASRDFAAMVLAPYEDQIDTIRNGSVDGEQNRQDYIEFVTALRDDPNVPKLVVEAAELAIANGYTDARFIDQLHIALDAVGASQIPILSELADLTNAGLYYVVDQDVVNGTVSLGGLVPLAGSGIVAARYSDEVVDAIDALADGKVALDAGVLRNTTNGDVVLRLDGGATVVLPPGASIANPSALPSYDRVLNLAPATPSGATLRADGLTTEQNKYFRQAIDNAPTAAAADAARYARYVAASPALGRTPLSQADWLATITPARTGRQLEPVGRAAVGDFYDVQLVDNNAVNRVEETIGGVTTRPDSVHVELVHEHKHLSGQTQVVYLTDQVEAQIQLAKQTDKDYVLSISSDNVDLANGQPRPSRTIKGDHVQVVFVDPATQTVSHIWDFDNKIWVEAY